MPLGRVPKIRNIIWLEPQDYVDLDLVYKPFRDFIALNQFIVRIVRIVIHNKEACEIIMPILFKEAGTSVIEKEATIVEKLVEYVSCPFCYRPFTDTGVKGLREHLLAEHSMKEVSPNAT